MSPRERLLPGYLINGNIKLIQKGANKNQDILMKKTEGALQGTEKKDD